MSTTTPGTDESRTTPAGGRWFKDRLPSVRGLGGRVLARVRKHRQKYQVLYRDPNTKRERSAGVFTRKSDALRRKRELEHLVDTGDWLDPELSRTNLVLWAVHWLTTRSHLKPKTIEGYESLLRLCAGGSCCFLVQVRGLVCRRGPKLQGRMRSWSDDQHGRFSGSASCVSCAGVCLRCYGMRRRRRTTTNDSDLDTSNGAVDDHHHCYDWNGNG